MADTPETAKLAEGEYRGIGGWLLVFLLLQPVAIAAIVWEVSKIAPWLESSDFRFLSENVPLFEWIIVGELLAKAVFVVGAIVGVLMAAMRSSHAPRLWRALLTFTLLAQLFDWWAIQQIGPSFQPHVDSETFFEFRGDMRAAQAELLARAPITGLWLLYWLASKRVANTFSDGTTPPVASTPSQDSSPADFFRGRATIECPHCGAHVLSTAEFCRSCKQPLADRESVSR